MNLDKLTIPSNITINYIQKKYYNKYLYKLLIDLDRSMLIKAESKQRWSSSSYMYYSNRFHVLSKTVEDIKSTIVDDDYRIRAEGITISVFTNSEENLTSIINKMPERVTCLYKPLNAAHVDMVENHKKVLVRENLFEKKYKFKVYLKPSWEQREKRFKEFKEWLEDSTLDYGINLALNQYFYTSKSMRGIGYTAAVYFNDPQDLMMFQLRFNDKIMKIEEAVLLSDL